jgi:class 3 adenylate cyclase
MSEPVASPLARLHPRAWPIAIKLGVAFVLTAVLPMIVVGYINLRASLDLVEAAEWRDLRQLTETAASRIDQFATDARHVLAYFAWSDEVIRIVDRPDVAVRNQVFDKMKRLLAANADIELLMVMDGKGDVVSASRPEYLGRNLAFRDYFRESIAGRDFLSHLEIGSISGKPGLYLAAPVRTPNGLIGGVAVMKMRGQTITEIVDAFRNDVRTAYLVDGDGVIVHHPDPQVIHRSLEPLSPAVLKEIREEKRFGDAEVKSLDLNGLAQAMRKARGSGHAIYVWTPDGNDRIAAFAPLQEQNWHVVISEDREEFAKPLWGLYYDALTSTLVVGAVFSLFGILFAQVFLRPIRRLSRSAEAVRAGDYDAARVACGGGDELDKLTDTFNAMVEGIKARERERDIFGRVVSPEVREKLLAGQIMLGGENRRVSVLFSDIRDFSTLSEKLSPQDVVALLNEYLTEMAEAIRPWGGYINNFIGDAIVVVFGAPESKAEIEWSAVGAALDMKMRLEVLNTRRMALGDPPLKTGIGISTGKVVAGQVGSLERFLYTVIGDAVNVAARLESMTKEFGGNPILINAATYDGISHREGLQIQDLGPRQVKGRGEPVHVYGVFGRL